MPAEIERKFRLDEAPPWLEEHPFAEIEQGYLAIVPGEREVRLRRRGDRLLEGVKLGYGEVRREQEVELEPAQFEALWPFTEGLRLTKRRHVVQEAPRLIEVDVYEGDLDGLVVAEVESASEEESHAFDPPAWMGEEVTGDLRYANETLARCGAPPAPAVER